MKVTYNLVYLSFKRAIYPHPPFLSTTTFAHAYDPNTATPVDAMTLHVTCMSWKLVTAKMFRYISYHLDHVVGLDVGLSLDKSGVHVV